MLLMISSRGHALSNSSLQCILKLFSISPELYTKQSVLLAEDLRVARAVLRIIVPCFTHTTASSSCPR